MGRVSGWFKDRGGGCVARISPHATRASVCRALTTRGPAVCLCRVPTAPRRAAYVYFVPFDKDDNRQKCAALMNIPNMTGFCPMYDQAAAQLANYYNQLVLDAAVEQNLGLPNAFYIDAVAEGGLIRTGVQLFPSGKMPAYPPAPATGVHTTTGYAYADSILLWNVRQVCGMPADSEAARQALAPETSAACTQLEALLSARRARNPLQRWSDPTYGRLLDWPPGF